MCHIIKSAAEHSHTQVNKDQSKGSDGTMAGLIETYLDAQINKLT